MALEHHQTMSVEEYFALEWLDESFEANGEVELPCLGVHFPLAAAYEDVAFTEIASPADERQ